MKTGIFGGGTAVGTIPCSQEAGHTIGYEASFGGARSAGLGSSSQGKVGAVSSDYLLSQLRQRRDRMASFYRSYGVTL